MQKIIKILLKDNILYIAIAVTITILYLSLMKVEKQPISFSNIDKVSHLIAYTTLTICWLLALKNKVKIWVIILFCVAFGIIIELLQASLTTYRTAEFYDIVANTAGTLIALLLFKAFFEKNKLFNN